MPAPALAAASKPSGLPWPKNKLLDQSCGSDHDLDYTGIKPLMLQKFLQSLGVSESKNEFRHECNI